MNATQDFVQIDQLSNVLLGPLSTPSSSQPSHSQEEFISPCVSLNSCPAPIECEDTSASETDIREPLKELSKNSGENQETADQEQAEESENSSEGTDKINEYVAKVLEKLM